ncbi:hypothetical protein [Mucilaginibacter sp.]|uniref:hypothetical protein n=1 Tax=Mucilaginibacter sp. TaxID=1882438 RepID=UPI0025F51946|nr:hypothetical protein [Mucilaginibacter sp.]
MTEKSNKIRILTALVFCSIFFAGAIFYPHIDAYLRNVNYLLTAFFMLVVFICIVVFFIKSVRRVVKKRKQLTFSIAMPALIYTTTMLLCYFLPNSESLKSEVVIAAYYKGTQNQADLRFRKNHTFDLHWSATFGYNEWFTGTYTQRRDTLFLTYADTTNKRIGKVILKKDGELVTLDKRTDSSYFAPFKIYKEQAKSK